MTTLAFTGTRKGLTEPQRHALNTVCFALLGNSEDVAIHGGAEGADEHFDDVAWFFHTRTEIYPCNNDRYVFWFKKMARDSRGRVIHGIEKPLVRNRIMVDHADLLIACPYEPEEQPRGGTWATFRYALNRNKHITLILPDGTVENYNDKIL